LPNLTAIEDAPLSIEDAPWNYLGDYEDELSPEFALIEFHDAMGIPVNNQPTKLTAEALKRSFALIREEVNELDNALFGTWAAPHALKEFADVLYTVYSLSVEAGYWPYVEEAFYRVHESNMSKIDPKTGKVEYRDDGKILKGPNYQPPNFDDMNVKYT
jgi:predicted HAD superfamily Cof-like phosphohydrolase